MTDPAWSRDSISSFVAAMLREGRSDVRVE